MLSPEEFGGFDQGDVEQTFWVLENLPEDAINIEIESAIYNVAGVIASKLSRDFNLSKLSKRDVALYISATDEDLAKLDTYVSKIHKYVKGYFYRKLQGPLTLVNCKY